MERPSAFSQKWRLNALEVRKVQDRLGEHVEAARRRWPAVRVPAEEFFDYVAERIPDSVSPLGAVEKTHIEDLYLAFAAARQDPAALAALEREWLECLNPKALRGSARSADLEELRQSLRERLLVGSPPKIAQYSGRAPLARWLNVVASRHMVSQHRRREPADPSPVPESFEHVGRDPELDYIQAHYRDCFRSAFRDAVAALPARERSLLRLHLGEGLTLDQIGRIYHVSRATVARLLATARESLVEGTRARLQQTQALSSSELTNLLTHFGSRLDITLSGLFKGKA